MKHGRVWYVTYVPGKVGSSGKKYFTSHSFFSYMILDPPKACHINAAICVKPSSLGKARPSSNSGKLANASFAFLTSVFLVPGLNGILASYATEPDGSVKMMVSNMLSPDNVRSMVLATGNSGNMLYLRVAFIP